MTAATPRPETRRESCLVDNHPAEHDCQRVQVDFAVRMQLRNQSYPMRATEMCGAGVTLRGQAPVAVGDKVELTIAFPGWRNPLAAEGKVVHATAGELRCEYWAVKPHEQQFLEQLVQACARRQELRKQGCAHQ